MEKKDTQRSAQEIKAVHILVVVVYSPHFTPTDFQLSRNKKNYYNNEKIQKL